MYVLFLVIGIAINLTGSFLYNCKVLILFEVVVNDWAFDIIEFRRVLWILNITWNLLQGYTWQDLNIYISNWTCLTSFSVCFVYLIKIHHTIIKHGTFKIEILFFFFYELKFANDVNIHFQETWTKRNVTKLLKGRSILFFLYLIWS